jgi:hypothetical protein
MRVRQVRCLDHAAQIAATLATEKLFIEARVRGQASPIEAGQSCCTAMHADP